MSIAGTRYQDLVDEVTRPAAWMPWTQDPQTLRHTDEANPDVPNPLVGLYIHDDEANLKDGQTVTIHVVRDDAAKLWGVWMFQGRDGKDSPVLTKVWEEKAPPIGSIVAVFSDRLVESAAGFKYHPIRVAHKPATAGDTELQVDPAPGSSGGKSVDDGIPF